MRVTRVHQQLAARTLDDERRLAVVIGMRVGTDQPAHISEAGIERAERALELFERTRHVEPAVDQCDAVGALERPGVDMRDARPGQR